MRKNMLSLLAVFFAGGFISFVALQSAPIALSAQIDRDGGSRERCHLEPGNAYTIAVNRRMVAPEGMYPIPCGSIRQGFYHDGKPKGSDKEHCGGDITMLLQDDGSLKHRCERCKRTWDESVAIDREKPR